MLRHFNCFLIRLQHYVVDVYDGFAHLASSVGYLLVLTVLHLYIQLFYIV